MERQLDYREQGLFGHLMAKYLRGELARAGEERDGKQMQLCFNYAQRFNLLPSRTNLIEFLSQMIKGRVADRQLIQRVRQAIQILPT